MIIELTCTVTNATPLVKTQSTSFKMLLKVWKRLNLNTRVLLPTRTLFIATKLLLSPFKTLLFILYFLMPPAARTPAVGAASILLCPIRLPAAKDPAIASVC